MDRAQSRDDGVVSDYDVAGDGRIVRENGLVTHLAFVGYVGVAEEEIVIANPSGSIRGGAPMDGGIFAKGVVIPDDELGPFAFVFEVLGLSPQGREGEGLAPFPDGGIALNNDVAAQV